MAQEWDRDVVDEWADKKEREEAYADADPKPRVQADERFVDLKSPFDVRDVKSFRNGRVVIVETNDGRVIFKRRARSQLEKLGGVDALKERDDIVVRALVIDNGVYYAVRVTTEGYTALPHRVLFDYARDVLKKLGIDSEPLVRKYHVRTVAYYKMAESKLSTGGSVVYYVAVSNANTGNKSVRVYGYVTVKHGNMTGGFAVREISAFVKTTHKGKAENILGRVSEAIKDVAKRLAKSHEELARRIESLGNVKVSTDEIRAWLQHERELLGRKYESWFARIFNESRQQLGDNALALFQALTFMASKVKNEKLSEELNKEANELLNDPRKYIDETTKP